MDDEKRRMISFDRDIIDEVVRLSGGKYSREQVGWVLKSSVSYIHHLMRYCDYLSVRIPFIGLMISNRREMEKRRKKIIRIRDKDGGVLKDPRMGIELESINKKIDKIDSMDGIKRGDPLIRNNPNNLIHGRQGLSWEDIQDFQKSKFNT